jgi:bidirectional [NiFe] hydrogenase diaphorase subunit
VPVVNIEGKSIDVAAGSTILEAARKARIWIPTLCYSPAVPALGICRICMVEVWNGREQVHDRPGRLVTSCNYPVRRDITVSVSSQRAVRVRNGVMQLLLARAPDSRELQDLAARMGVRGTPYPKVTESQRNCILCGLCVAVCEEVIGASAIGFAGRGVDRAVAAPFRQPSESCIACGACAAVCPVGTIQIRIHADTAEAEISPFKSRAKLLLCEECGVRTVSVPLSQAIGDRVKIDWEEYRKLARLCPVCRRKHTARALGIGASEGQVTPLEQLIAKN